MSRQGFCFFKGGDASLDAVTYSSVPVRQQQFECSAQPMSLAFFGEERSCWYTGLSANFLRVRATRPEQTYRGPLRCHFGSSWHRIPQPFLKLRRVTYSYCYLDLYVQGLASCYPRFGFTSRFGKPIARRGHFSHKSLKRLLPAARHYEGLQKLRSSDVDKKQVKV